MFIAQRPKYWEMVMNGLAGMTPNWIDSCPDGLPAECAQVRFVAGLLATSPRLYPQ